MAAPAGELLVKLAMDMADFQRDINKGVREIERFGDRAMSAAKAVAAIAVGGFATDMIRSTNAATAKLDDMAEKTALAVETLSSLERTATIGGHSLDTISSSATKFAKSVSEAMGGNKDLVRTFEALGISQEQLRSQRFDDLYLDFAKKIGTAEDRTNAIGFATKLAGKSAAEAIPFWRDLAATGLEQARVTAKMAADAEQLEKDTRRLTLSLRDMKQDIVVGIVPALQSVVDQMNAARDAAKDAGTAFTNFFSISGKQANEPAAALAEVERRLSRLKADQDVLAGPSLGARFNRMMAPEDLSILRKQIQFAEAQRATLARLVGKNAPKDIHAFDPNMVGETLGSPPANADAMMKRQIAAIQQMEEKKRALFQLNEQELMQNRVASGTYAEFDAATKRRLIDMAREIDLRAQNIARIESEQAVIRAAVETNERAYELRVAASQADRAAVDQLAFETSMIGKTAAEQERLNAIRQVDIQLLERKRQIAQTYGEDVAGAMVAVAKAEEDATRQRNAMSEGVGGRQQAQRNEAVRQAIELQHSEAAALGMTRRELEQVQAIRALDQQQFGRVLSEQERSVMLTHQDLEARRLLTAEIIRRQELERSWQTGAIQGLNAYADAATNAAAHAQTIFSTAFRGMEDALVKFVTTGKLNFKDLANSIIADMARIAIQQSITGPLAGALGGMIGGIFGGPAGAVGGSLIGDFGVSSIGFAAEGGYIGGPTIVGERGPELFLPGRGGTVIPNHELGGGDTVNVHITVQCLDPRTAANVIQAHVPMIAGQLERMANGRGRSTSFGGR